jgi:hypothetical protein
MNDPWIPARMPPPGVTSNFIDPVNTGYQQTICNVLCSIFVAIFVGMRIYTRIKLVKCVSWDDCKYSNSSCSKRISAIEWLADAKADLIIVATLVFYADVGCFQYIIEVGLVRMDLFKYSFFFSNTFNRADIYGTSAQKDSRLSSWRSGRLLP